MPEPAPPRLRLLIDACLTPAAVPGLGRLFGERIDVIHVDQVLAPGTPDDAVLAWATREARAVLTANTMDFVDLARAGLTHHGLGLINDQNTRSRQLTAIEDLVRAIMGYVEAGGDLTDHVFVLRPAGRLSVRRIP
jgi:predicted nuclease of predicted toxin-antitoxin system